MNSKKLLILLVLALTTSGLNAQSRKTKRSKAKSTIVKPKPTDNMPAMSPKAKALFDDMLTNTQKVFVIDSTVVDINNVLDEIPLPASYGKFVKYNSFFNTDEANDSYVFVNGFGNRCYYTEMGTDSIARLYTRDMVGSQWGEAKPVKSVNGKFKNISFPFMSSDGQTLYFAGVSDDEGLGKRDIYMTKIEAGEGTFLNAENIGLPFNSPSDDFAYIVADAAKLAWFASTRNQPEGKVCVYTFVPTDTRQNYEALSMGEKELHSLACLNRIRATWPTPEKRESAMQQLNQLKQENSLTHSKADGINFVINDRITYNSIDQFKSDETRMAYYETVRLRNELTSKTAKLSAMRAQYHTAADGDKAQIGLKIQQLELQTDELRQTLKRALGELRQKESKI